MNKVKASLGKYQAVPIVTVHTGPRDFFEVRGHSPDSFSLTAYAAGSLGLPLLASREGLEAIRDGIQAMLDNYKNQ